ncbi:MAG: ABC transporter permease [Clostridia bacterium]|nr:ABC transporter permease [Clostridia bacterium]
MKNRMRVILIICLVLGIALTGLAIYAGSHADRVAEINEVLNAQRMAEAQARAAELLGKEVEVSQEIAEIEITREDEIAMALYGQYSLFLVLGIDLMIIGLGGLIYNAVKKKRSARAGKVSSSGSIWGILLALIVLCLDLALATNVFLTASNFLNVLQQISINFVIAVGMTFVIISGGIDLSVGSNIALSGLLMAILMKNFGVGVVPTIIICILFSGAIGLINGLMIAYLDLPPFIATLGMMSIARGAAYTVTGGQPLYTMPAGFTAISSRVGGVPLYGILIMLAVFLLGWYALKYTRAGRFTYAIGGNENCARLSGINIAKSKCLVYTISGLCCGVAALLLTSRLDSAVPTNADGQEMDAIAAVVIGGTSMKGGEGSMIGTLIGILIIGVISNGLNLLGVAQGPQKMVKGLIIVVAVIIDVVRRKASESVK